MERWRIFETEIANRIAAGLNHFARVVVTADHGASRLAVIAHNEGKGTTLPWEGQWTIGGIRLPRRVFHDRRN